MEKAKRKQDGVAEIFKQGRGSGVLLEFFCNLSDREKLILSAFDSYVYALEDFANQDAVRTAIEDYDPANIPAELQFLLGVVAALDAIAAA